jgi:Lrp/AsnC family leucine-responsive transcriptional regulator
VSVRPSRRGKRSPTPLDAIDLRILDVLRTEARITNQALSKRVGLSPRPTLERVRRLESTGVIRGYTTLLDAGATGHEIIAFAQIVMRDPSAAARQRLEHAFARHPAVMEAHVVNGVADYLVRFVAESLADYEQLTGDFLGDPAFGIGRIETTFILRTLKEFRGYPPHSSPADAI